MKNAIQFILSLFVAVLCVSCGSQRKVTNSKVRATAGLDKYNSNYEYTKDANGLQRVTSNSRSQYDKGKSASIGARGYNGKNYGKQSYRKKRWGGNDSYDVSQYGGKTDGSRFQHAPLTVSRDGKSSQSYGSYNKRGGYRTGQYATSGAYEQRAQAARTKQSDYAATRGNGGKRAKAPVMSKQQYAEINIKQTRGLLGR